MPCPISSPQLGVGAGRPKPRKSSATSALMFATIDERRKRDDRRQRVRQDVPEHDARLGHAGRDRRADIVLRFLPIELAANVVGDAHPVEARQDDDQQPERRLQQQIAAGQIDRARRSS